MKLFVLLLVGCIILSTAMAIECEEGEVMICHKPLKQNTTMCIIEAEVAEHLEHGDFLGSCETGEEIPIEENIPPSIPILLSPETEEVLYSNTVFFNWTDSEDVDSGVVSYNIVVDDCVNNTIIDINLNIPPYSAELTDASVYCWKVRAYDSLDYSDWSEQRVFVINSKTIESSSGGGGGGGSVSKTEQMNEERFSEVELFEVKNTDTAWLWILLSGLGLSGLVYVIYKKWK